MGPHQGATESDFDLVAGMIDILAQAAARYLMVSAFLAGCAWFSNVDSGTGSGKTQGERDETPEDGQAVEA